MKKVLYKRELKGHDVDPPRNTRLVKASNRWVTIDADTGQPCPDPERFVGTLEVFVADDWAIKARVSTPRWSREAGDWDEYKSLSLDEAERLGWDGIVPAEWISSARAAEEEKDAQRAAFRKWLPTVDGKKLPNDLEISGSWVVDPFGNLLFQLPERVLSEEELRELALTFEPEFID